MIFLFFLSLMHIMYGTQEDIQVFPVPVRIPRIALR